ncbi:hippocampus abundant transcript 1 protein [Exaiptasia diaphana]|uniref:Major facilitator superfamily (MFS) profile domain-containing protein n=1 Tax=Exaiptasia diaphana TaxID=2652724 RepID=A0A913YAN9_EXADI|nr:hippocampus abundant transcript 1 protein [Exaiptasia diaphana]KXJ19279.1 Hippocampus abundant transcript 1 protein [Exaiptasia diaphana]
MNGLIHGIKGILSFLSAPLLGALSDVWGRKSFLLLTVFFTCSPIPLLRFNPWWFFAMISVSGIFSVTFSIVFAYVADCTDENERSTAYGLVSATFAASLIISPALGAFLGSTYNDNFVVALATAVASLDILFILVAVPESLPERIRPASWGAPISWEQADPFASLRKVGQDPTVLLLSLTVFLSYLPEAGQYSSMFLYLKQVIHFSSEDVATFIAVLGILSVIAQTLVLTCLKKTIGLKNSVIVGLIFQLLQLSWYGLGTHRWMMWAAGSLASVAMITYPAISALVSCNADPDQQGVVQGIITGIRGLCNGIGPALFGFTFYLFHVNLDDMPTTPPTIQTNHTMMEDPFSKNMVVGAPFLFGAGSVILALLLAFFIPDNASLSGNSRSPTRKEYVYSGGTLDSVTKEDTSDNVPLLLQETS